MLLVIVNNMLILFNKIYLYAIPHLTLEPTVIYIEKYSWKAEYVIQPLAGIWYMRLIPGKMF